MRLLCWVSSLLLLVPVLAAGQGLHETSGPWVLERSGTTAGLRGIHAVGGGVAWASGTSGTVLRTEDGGYEWQSCGMPPGAEKLDFRGIWAWDDNTAIVMASGPGEQSRLYKTTDGCSHWRLVFTNPDRDGFWDAMVFQTRKRGHLLGDPVGGRFAFFTTTNGGETWSRSTATGLQSPPDAKGAFAASNSSLLGSGREPVAFGTGGAWYYWQAFSGAIALPMKPGTPIPMTEQWNRVPVPLAEDGDAAGIFSLGWHEGEVVGYGFTVVAVGGDYSRPNDSAGTCRVVLGWREDVDGGGEASAWVPVGGGLGCGGEGVDCGGD